MVILSIRSYSREEPQSVVTSKANKANTSRSLSVAHDVFYIAEAHHKSQTQTYPQFHLLVRKSSNQSKTKPNQHTMPEILKCPKCDANADVTKDGKNDKDYFCTTVLFC